MQTSKLEEHYSFEQMFNRLSWHEAIFRTNRIHDSLQPALWYSGDLTQHINYVKLSK